MVRKTAHYSGHVQGVGFRATVVHTARGYDVAGYVRNTPDGNVELVAEGQRQEVIAFLDAVANRMRDYIRHVEVVDGSASGKYTRFEIQY
ncbi:acylphosphatase [Planctomycetales bacterium ZRK34]|nr:acylphosphatase [Planctomycetales bacterium ZRK34]